MLRCRLLPRSPVSWPVAVAIGIAMLAVGLPAAPLPHALPPRAEEAREPRPPSTDSRRDSPLPTLFGDKGYGPTDTALRPERSASRPAASRSLGPCSLASSPGRPPRCPHLETGRFLLQVDPWHLARASLHVLLCVWLT